MAVFTSFVSACESARIRLSAIPSIAQNAVVIPESLMGPGTVSETWTIVHETLGEVPVLIITVSGACSGMERAACVAAMAERGVSSLFLVATGSPVSAFSDDIIAIRDHINLLGDNPLIGGRDPSLGPRFPDMSEPYSRRLLDIARHCGVSGDGIYVCCASPRAVRPDMREVLTSLGRVVAGRWVVPETIAARQAGMSVLALVTAARADYNRDWAGRWRNIIQEVLKAKRS